MLCCVGVLLCAGKIADLLLSTSMGSVLACGCPTNCWQPGNNRTASLCHQLLCPASPLDQQLALFNLLPPMGRKKKKRKEWCCASHQLLLFQPPAANCHQPATNCCCCCYIFCSSLTVSSSPLICRWAVFINTASWPSCRDMQQYSTVQDGTGQLGQSSVVDGVLPGAVTAGTAAGGQKGHTNTVPGTSCSVVGDNACAHLHHHNLKKTDASVHCIVTHHAAAGASQPPGGLPPLLQFLCPRHTCDTSPTGRGFPLQPTHCHFSLCTSPHSPSSPCLPVCSVLRLTSPAPCCLPACLPAWLPAPHLDF